MSDEKILDARIRLLNAASHDLAMEASESGDDAQEALSEFGVDLSVAKEALAARARSAIASARRGRLERARAERLASTKAGLKRFGDWTREQLLERWEQLQLQFPGQLQVAHRELQTKPLEDLRTLVEDFERMVLDDER